MCADFRLLHAFIINYYYSIYLADNLISMMCGGNLIHKEESLSQRMNST